MASRKIQLLRSSQLYADLATAKATLNASLANTANLVDGEMVLARYLDGSNIKSILGIYGNKNGKNGWTFIQDTSEMSEFIAALDYSLNVDDVVDSAETLVTEDEGVVITAISQTDGQISAGTTSVIDLVLDGYSNSGVGSGTIGNGDTLEDAFSKLEDTIAENDNAHTLVSDDESIIISTVDSGDDEGKTNVTVNFDGETIVQDTTTNALKTALTIIKGSTIPNHQFSDPNVLEEYYLTDSTGENFYGETIKIYKDSSLKEVYIGTIGDEIDEQTGVITRASYIIDSQFMGVESETYEELNAYEQAMYDAYDEYSYVIKEEYIGLTTTEYQEIIANLETLSYHEASSQNASGNGEAFDDYQYLNFVYELSDGSYELVKVDMSKFLTEYEFGEGLTVINGVVNVVVDQQSAIYLKSSPTGRKRVSLKLDGGSLTQSSDGLKVQLSQTTLTNQADAQYAGETTETEEGGQTVITDVHNNVLQIKNDGLYLDSTWDCGEY